MADILPYLGVKHTYTEEDAAGKLVVLENLTGLTAADAQKRLKQQGLTCILQGAQDVVTAQLPQAGQSVPGDSQVILYLGDEPEKTKVNVPDFMGMTRQQAYDAAGVLGLNIYAKGNDAVAPNVTVVSQSIPKNNKVTLGTTIELMFIDTKAAD